MKPLATLILAALFAACSKPSTPSLPPAPDVSLTFLQSDKPTPLSQLRGTPLLIEFWSTWCEPCVEEIPHLAGLAKKFEGKPLKFISISDEDRATVETFIKTHPIPGLVAYDGAEAFRAFGVRGRPKTILIDAQGRIAAKTYPGILADKDLDDLIAGKALTAKPGFTEETAPAGGDALLEVRVAVASGTNATSSMRFSDTKFQVRNVPLAGIVPHAYDLPRDRVILENLSGPVRYDVDVIVPREAAGSVKEFLRRGLETSLSLKSRKENRTLNALVMRKAAKAPGLKPSSRKEEEALSYGYDGVKLKGVTMADLARYLEDGADKPVFDETRIPGRYDVEVKWEGGKEESMRAAVLKELGLKLEPARRSVGVVVVSREAKKPDAKNR